MKIDHMNVQVEGYYDAFDPADSDLLVKSVTVSGPAGGKTLDLSARAITCPINATQLARELLVDDEVDPGTVVTVGRDHLVHYYPFLPSRSRRRR